MKLSQIKKALLATLSLGMLVMISACDTTVVVEPTNPGGGTPVDPIRYAWYDLYGNGCATSAAGPRPGCNFFYYDNQLVKIIDAEDPYFYEEYYNLAYDTYYFYLNGQQYYYQGFAWVSPTGIIYDEFGNALNQKKGKGRNVIGDVAKAEKKVVEAAGKAFASRYALSVNKGIEIARTLNDYAKIGKDRIRNEADLASFTQRLYGVEYARVKDALAESQKGNQEALNKTVAEAAQNWGTSEENMKKILKNFYKGFVK